MSELRTSEERCAAGDHRLATYGKGICLDCGWPEHIPPGTKSTLSSNERARFERWVKSGVYQAAVRRVIECMWTAWEAACSAPETRRAAPVYREGTSLFQIIQDGISRDFKASQVVDEASRSGFCITEDLVSAVRRDFDATLAADTAHEIRFGAPMSSDRVAHSDSSDEPWNTTTKYGRADLTLHPAVRECYRVACLIERCGASEQLTQASSAAFELTEKVFDLILAFCGQGIADEKELKLLRKALGNEANAEKANAPVQVGPVELPNPPTLVALIEYLARSMYASVLPPTRGVFLQDLFAVCRLMVKSGIGTKLLTRPQLQELGMLSRDPPPPSDICEHNIPRRFCTALHAPPSHSEVAASVNAAIDSMT